MELLFNNTPFYQREKMQQIFKDKNALIDYFNEFKKYYFEAKKDIEPKSIKRMQGKYVKNYTEIHKKFNELSHHYNLLLVTGLNLYDIFLNDYL